MPVCRKCGLSFSNWLFIKGKKRNLQRRKFCVHCSPFGEHNTNSSILPPDEKEELFLRRKEKRHNQKRHYDRTYTSRLRDRALETLGNSCVICGNADKRILQFDHINGGGNKNKSGWGRRKLYLDIIYKRRNDVQILCANCHSIKTWENGEYRRNVPLYSSSDKRRSF